MMKKINARVVKHVGQSVVILCVSLVGIGSSGCVSKWGVKADLNVSRDAPKSGWGCKFTRLNRVKCMTRF